MDAETAALEFALGRAQAATLERHEMGKAVDSLRRAFDYYADVGDVARAIVVAEYPLPNCMRPVRARLSSSRAPSRFFRQIPARRDASCPAMAW